jgi:hypothetical protein
MGTLLDRRQLYAFEDVWRGKIGNEEGERREKKR